MPIPPRNTSLRLYLSGLQANPSFDQSSSCPLVQIPSQFHRHTGQCIRAGAENYGAERVVELGNRAEILPAHSQVDGEVRTNLPVVLGKESEERGAGVLADIGG